MVQKVFALVLYVFTVGSAFLLACALPMALYEMVTEFKSRHRNALIATTLIVAAGFIAGGLIGWSLRPVLWGMPFWETLDASVNAKKYGHALESKAERLTLFVLFCADIGAIAAGLAAAVTARRTLRREA